MEKRFRSNLVGLGVALLVLCSCAPLPSPTPAPTAWQQTVDALDALKPDELPPHLQQAGAAKDGSEFDTNRYFSVLTHLSMEPGYVLDYVYYYDGLGGLPMLYARPADQSPYETYSAYRAAVGDPSEQRSSYIDHVRTDGTAEGFFQLVVMRISAGQFYLFWHANYNDAQLICDNARLEALIAERQDGSLKLPDDVVRQARALDFTPAVEFQGNTVRVRVVTFSQWTGFSEEIYTLGTTFPYPWIDTTTKVLVPYNCGIIF